ncbi:lantibiotic dehydratase [Marivirga arenosa]|uniref:Lantibiotic dehydratase n=1 Tax=Marivirga arenosa TaxID=3059076 RepID=A0AA51ZXH1_9BACT|nr:lantibiotic dehydratase [Marivirga sp. BKB1-2]WNB18522.1 lantibiotic dehydratase [Marivirga sp. BKB1-2]
MQISKNLRYYLLRTPVLPIEEAFEFIEADFNQNKDLIADKISKPFIEDSFFLASPDFMTALKKYMSEVKYFSVDDKVVKSFYKYFVRMSSRCTPFGLFAGCAVGTFSDQSKIKFDSNKYKSVSRLDMYYVSAITDYFNKIPLLRNQLRFFPNETIYPNGNNYRYIEYINTRSSRSYKISGFSGNSLICELLQVAQKGMYFSELKRFLINKKFKEEEVDNYLQQLIESQILVSDLLPSITGEEYFTVLIERLKKLNSTEDIVRDLEDVNSVVKKGRWSEEKKVTIEKILSKYIPIDTKNIVQTDLFFNTVTNTVNKSVISEISKLVTEYTSSEEFQSPYSMGDFAIKFQKKYGDREIPLLRALDNETGIGYKVSDSSSTAYMPLLENMKFSKSGYHSRNSWDSSKGKKVKILLDALKKGLQSVDLKSYSPKPNQTARDKMKVPKSMFMFGSLLSKSTETLDSGEFNFLLSAIGGPSGANLLGRFCSGDQQLQQFVQESLQEEEATNEEIIFAEIVHLPDGRTGNVVMRPTLRDYEIPILTNSSVDEEHTIKLSDLLVSVIGDKVVVRSKKLNKRVIPRLTNAHNYHNGLPVYKFLSDLQFQGFCRPHLWEWSILADQPFLPRIQYGKLILERATWNLSKASFLKRPSDESPSEYFKQLKEKLNMPDKVVLVEGDNELLLSLTSLISVNILTDKLKKRDIKLKEYLFSSENTFIKDEKGSYANELIVPFSTVHEEPIYSNSGRLQRQIATPEKRAILKRNFKVGDSWIYFKVFTGSKTADKILIDIIKPLSEELLVEGVIEKWFFIRYVEHGNHIRVRFYNSQKADFWVEVIKRMKDAFSSLQENGLVSQMQIDSYDREIERYGNATMELSEQMFFYDSIAITEFLDLIDGDTGEEYRWLLALLNIDSLLNDFQLTLHEKFQLLSQLKEYFYEETNNGSKNKSLWVSLNNKYRQYSKVIFDLLDQNTFEKEDISEAIQCFKRRSERNKILVGEVLSKFNSDKKVSDVSLFSFLSSHIHMTLNRTFIAKQRIHETVIYHLLAKYYDSKLSRIESLRKKNISSQLQLENS